MDLPLSTSPNRSPAPPLVEMRGIDKRFAGSRALEGVDFSLLSGEVHVLLGENGAGKSTLMKILAGVYQADAGEVELAGGSVRPRSVREAQDQGVVMVMQEFNLVPDLTVAENVVLVNRPGGPLFGRVRRRALEAEAAQILIRLGIKVRASELVRRLSVAEKQMVEIAKAMSRQARVLVLDEPTAALSDAEVSRLFQLIRELKEGGIGIVYISHRFEEIYTVGDRVTVLRDGRFISTRRLAEVSRERLLMDMAGRELAELYPRNRTVPGEAALEVLELASGKRVARASLTVRRGEIVGLAGLMGAGRTDLAKAVFGAREVSAGRVKVRGREVRFSNPSDALALGVAYCAEDRKDEGLFLDKSLAFNVTISDLTPILRRGLLSFEKETAVARGFIDRLAIRPPEPARPGRTFSGGGQQKIMLAKWLHTKPQVLILDEPTRGIDVAAKVEIYNLMDRFVADGGAILLISSDLPELMAMSDRIVVMHEGKTVGERVHPDFRSEDILSLATGLQRDNTNISENSAVN